MSESKHPSTEGPAAGEIVAYLQATAPRLATALTRERLGFLKEIARNRRLLEAGERAAEALSHLEKDLERIQAENERLRAASEQLLEACKGAQDTITELSTRYWSDHVRKHALDQALAPIRAALAAYQEAAKS